MEGGLLPEAEANLLGFAADWVGVSGAAAALQRHVRVLYDEPIVPLLRLFNRLPQSLRNGELETALRIGQLMSELGLFSAEKALRRLSFGDTEWMVSQVLFPNTSLPVVGHRGQSNLSNGVWMLCEPQWDILLHTVTHALPAAGHQIIAAVVLASADHSAPLHMRSASLATARRDADARCVRVVDMFSVESCIAAEVTSVTDRLHALDLAIENSLSATAQRLAERIGPVDVDLLVDVLQSWHSPRRQLHAIQYREGGWSSVTMNGERARAGRSVQSEIDTQRTAIASLVTAAVTTGWHVPIVVDLIVGNTRDRTTGTIATFWYLP